MAHRRDTYFHTAFKSLDDCRDELRLQLTDSTRPLFGRVWNDYSFRIYARQGILRWLYVYAGHIREVDGEIQLIGDITLGKLPRGITAALVIAAVLIIQQSNLTMPLMAYLMFGIPFSILIAAELIFRWDDRLYHQLVDSLGTKQNQQDI